MRAIISHTHVGAVRTLHSLRRTSSWPIFNERIIYISVARSSRCSVVDIGEKDNWFGSAISFARSSRYVSRYVSSSVVRCNGGAMAIPSRFNIREKRAGHLLTDDWYATPSGVFIFVFPSAYLFCKIIETVICVCRATVYNHGEKKKEDDWVIALCDSTDLHRVYLLLYFFLLLYKLLIIVIFVINFQIKTYHV